MKKSKILTGKDLYDLAVKDVHDNCKRESINIVKINLAGFKMTDLNNGKKLSQRTFNEMYAATGADRWRVKVHYYSYDPSRPLIGLARMAEVNVFCVRLLDEGGNKIEEHYNSFQD